MGGSWFVRLQPCGLFALSLVRRGLFLSNFVSVQVEELFHLFAWASGKGPILGVVVGIDDSEHDTAHMARVGRCEIGAVEEVEGEALAVRRGCGCHAGLV